MHVHRCNDLQPYAYTHVLLNTHTHTCMHVNVIVVSVGTPTFYNKQAQEINLIVILNIELIFLFFIGPELMT